MGSLKRFFRRLANVFLPGRADNALARELATHLSLLEDEYRRRGMSTDEARRAARLALGGVEQTKELYRGARSFLHIDDARRDVSYAVRVLRRHPIVAATAMLSLAIGIGLNAAVFSVVDWVLLRPLPYPSPHELVRVFTGGTSPITGPSALTHGEFVAFARATVFRTSVAFTTATRVIAASGIEPVHVVIARIDGNLFATLGVYPELGRAFTSEELSAGAPVVVLSHGLWQRRFQGD